MMPMEATPKSPKVTNTSMRPNPEDFRSFCAHLNFDIELLQLDHISRLLYKLLELRSVKLQPSDMTVELGECFISMRAAEQNLNEKNQ